MTDRSVTSAQQDQIEQLVDACGLQLVLAALANICAEKSDHVLVNWQDRRLACAWMEAMTAVDRVVGNRYVVEVSQ